ncbi:MAG TPA: ATP-binding protein, partial [Vicinamibacterales bacterium]|nr:ATP-binding protein [Vicinamibacterales bacterium]
QSYTERFAELVGFAVTFHAEGFSQRLAPHVELVLYRVIQEALTNVARHANATRVEVTIRTGGAGLTLEVRDNGKGIALDALRDPKALGLLGMQERVMPFAGSVEISASRGKGTRVVVSVPNDRTPRPEPARPRSKGPAGKSGPDARERLP